MLILGDLGCLAAEWSGWRVSKGTLYSPEGWEITVNDVLATPLMRQQLEGYKTELRQIREAVERLNEQPLPDVWPEWVFEMRA